MKTSIIKWLRSAGRSSSASGASEAEFAEHLLVPCPPDAPGAVRLPVGLPERLKTLAYLPQPELETLSRVLLSPMAAQLKRRLENAVAALPDEKREFFTLHHNEGKTAADIAAARGLNETDVFQEITRIDAEIASVLHGAQLEYSIDEETSAQGGMN